MMLRTTFSRIKRVCSFTFTPRLLRADQRFAAAKFELFSNAGLRKAQKSTKSTDDDEFEHKKEKHKDSCEYIIVPQSKRSEKSKSDLEKSLRQGNYRGNVYTTKKPLRETQCEKCQRLIDQAFGKDDVDSIMTQQYFSHSINIEETRREIDKAEMARVRFEQEKKIEKPISDNRIQFGALKRELIEEDTTVEPDDLIMNESILKSVEKKEEKKAIVESKQTEEFVDDSSLIPRTLNIYVAEKNQDNIAEKMENVHETETLKSENTMEIDTELPTKNEYKQNFYQVRNLDITLPLKASAGEEAADNYVHDDGIWNNKDMPTVQTNVDKTSEDAKDVNKTDTIYTTATNRQIVDNNEINENKLNWNKENLEKPDHAIRATTAKENEEQLTQKVEHIDETPLVEAQRQTIEGFNVTPRVLGAMDNTINCICDKGGGNPNAGASSGLDVPARFDEVAKRCLDTPTNKIDEILLKEMEKLGVPITSNKDSTSDSHVIENDLVQMDVLKKQPRRPVDKNDLDLESRECERDAAALYKNENTLTPSYTVCKETILPDQNEETSNIQNINKAQLFPRIHPHQVLIDPYDKKTLAYDTGEYDPNEKLPPYEFSYFYIPRAKLAEVSDATDVEVTFPIDKPIKDTSENVSTQKQSHQRRMSMIAGTRRRGQSERNQEFKQEHPLARQIDEVYLKCNKKKLSSQTEFLHSEKLHCEQAEREATKINKNDSITYPFLTSKISTSEGISEEKSDPKADPTPDPQPDAKPAMNQAQYANTRQNDTEPTFDQSKMYGPYNMWHPQQYHQSQNQVAQHTYPERTDGKPPFAPPPAPPHLCVTNGTWCQRSFAPQQHANDTQQQVNTQQHFNTQHTQQQQHVNTHQHFNTQHVNTPEHVNTQQHANTEHTSPKEYNTTYYNKTNMCVSDGIWDTEQINCEQPLNQLKNKDESTASFQTPTQEVKQMESNPAAKQVQNNYAQATDEASFDKPKQTIQDNIWTKEQLDPKHVLTCNETCPISPKSHVNATETSRFVDTQAIFEDDFMKTARSLRPVRDPLPECEDDIPNKAEKRPSGSAETQRISNFMQADSVLNPMVNKQTPFPSSTVSDGIVASNKTAINPMPEVNKTVSLSELLKRVRTKSRNVECKSELNSLGVQVDPVEAKCGNKSRNCPPMAPRTPLNNPIPPPSFGLPKLKPRPRACPRRRPKTKCSTCELDISSGLQLGLKAYERNAETDVIRTKSMADLTEEVIDRLQTLGKFLGEVLHQGKAEDFETNNRRGSKILLARDFEPWAPIPSWPNVKKGRQDPRKNRCAPGCKIFPPTRAENDPRCEPRPCTGFPRRTFSLLDCFAFSLVRNEDSPVLSRSFYKTEWTKPKFDVSKPYTDSRENADDVKSDVVYREKKQLPPSKKTRRDVSKVTGRTFSSKASCSLNIPNFSHKKETPNVFPQISNLNLERLLAPPMASVSYVIVRCYASEKEKRKDVFWRPRTRIPLDPNWRLNIQNPEELKEKEKEARYLLLSFDEMQTSKKKTSNRAPRPNLKKTVTSKH